MCQLNLKDSMKAKLLHKAVEKKGIKKNHKLLPLSILLKNVKSFFFLKEQEPE